MPWLPPPNHSHYRASVLPVIPKFLWNRHSARIAVRRCSHRLLRPSQRHQRQQFAPIVDDRTPQEHASVEDAEAHSRQAHLLPHLLRCTHKQALMGNRRSTSSRNMALSIRSKGSSTSSIHNRGSNIPSNTGRWDISNSQWLGSSRWCYAVQFVWPCHRWERPTVPAAALTWRALFPLLLLSRCRASREVLEASCKVVVARWR